MHPWAIAAAGLGACVRVAVATTSSTKTVWVTPHDSYSSSVGVLGCKVNTNRIAYWPAAVDCNNICVSLSYGGRQVYLLRVDQSGGAYDVSYDAWNYLTTGRSATEDPTAGGAVAMKAKDVDASKCVDLLKGTGGKLPLSASNSMDFVNSCLTQQAAHNPNWVATHYKLYNILDAICTYGHDESCTLTDWPSQNQPACKHTLGAPVALKSNPVYNIQYPTGKKVLAGAPPSSSSTDTPNASKAGAVDADWHPSLLWATVAVVLCAAGL